MRRLVDQPAAAKIKMFGDQEGMPTINLRSVEREVEDSYLEFRNVSKFTVSHRESGLNKTKEQFQLLFDIAACKCKLLSRCSCPKSQKVPADEVRFLKDQRTKRQLTLENVGVIGTRRGARRQKRRQNAAALSGVRSPADVAGRCGLTDSSADQQPANIGVDDPTASDDDGQPDTSTLTAWSVALTAGWTAQSGLRQHPTATQAGMMSSWSMWLGLPIASESLIGWWPQ